MKTVFFDLDGTLLDMDLTDFVMNYYRLLTQYAAANGYEPQRFMKALDRGVEAMLANDGSQSNETVFWKVMEDEYGTQIHDSKQMFEQFYLNDFQKIRDFSTQNPALIEIIETFRDKVPMVVATNPLFPEIATRSRLGWAGFDPQDFQAITTYENSRFCKPNPAYFQDLLAALGLKPEEVLMIGNDYLEDGIASTLGMEVFLLDRHLLHGDHPLARNIPSGDEKALKEKISEFVYGNQRDQ